MPSQRDERRAVMVVPPGAPHIAGVAWAGDDPPVAAQRRRSAAARHVSAACGALLWAWRRVIPSLTPSSAESS